MKSYQKYLSSSIPCTQEGNTSLTFWLDSKQIKSSREGKTQVHSLDRSAGYGSHLILLQEALFCGESSVD